VDKYRNEGDATLSRRIARLNIHSIGKKSARYTSAKKIRLIRLEEKGMKYAVGTFSKVFHLLRVYVYFMKTSKI
jgi:hypothetical protein